MDIFKNWKENIISQTVVEDKPPSFKLNNIESVSIDKSEDKYTLDQTSLKA
jgi:hypothetical protein